MSRSRSRSRSRSQISKTSKKTAEDIFNKILNRCPSKSFGKLFSNYPNLPKKNSKLDKDTFDKLVDLIEKKADELFDSPKYKKMIKCMNNLGYPYSDIMTSTNKRFLISDKSKASSVKPRIIHLIGTSCSGKTHLVSNFLRKKLPDTVFFSSDVIFDELKLKPSNKSRRWKDLKPEVRPTMVKKALVALKNGKNVLLEDNTPALVQEPRLAHFPQKTVLLYTPLDFAGKNLLSRKAGDRRLPSGVVRDFMDLYIPGDPLSSKNIGIVDIKTVKDLLDIESSANAKIKSLLTAFKKKFGEKGHFTTSFDTDLVLDTSKTRDSEQSKAIRAIMKSN